LVKSTRNFSVFTKYGSSEHDFTHLVIRDMDNWIGRLAIDIGRVGGPYNIGCQGPSINNGWRAPTLQYKLFINL